VDETLLGYSGRLRFLLQHLYVTIFPHLFSLQLYKTDCAEDNGNFQDDGDDDNNNDGKDNDFDLSASAQKHPSSLQKAAARKSAKKTANKSTTNKVDNMNVIDESILLSTSST
jgi:hypothetical protein